MVGAFTKPVAICCDNHPNFLKDWYDLMTKRSLQVIPFCGKATLKMAYNTGTSRNSVVVKGIFVL